MDIPIGLLIIAIFVILLAIAWLVKIELPRRDSERYQNELRAETALLERVKPVVGNGFVMLPTIDDGKLVWIRQDAPIVPQAAPVSNAAPIVIDETPSPLDPALDIARQIIIASIDKVGNDNRVLPAHAFTSDKTWARGINALKSRGLIRTDSSGTYPAVSHDLEWVLTQLEKEMNLTGAITALPRAASQEQRIKLAGNGNGNA